MDFKINKPSFFVINRFLKCNKSFSENGEQNPEDCEAIFGIILYRAVIFY